MRNATIISCNKAGIISTAMIWHDETDKTEMVQLTIGGYKYLFNNEGKLQSSSELQSCSKDNNSQFNCSQKPAYGINCVPTDFKTEG